MQPSFKSEAAHLKQQVACNCHSFLVGHLHSVWTASDHHAMVTVKCVNYSFVAVGLHL